MLHHPDIIEIMEAALPLMGMDTSILYKPMPNSITFYSLYCVGNRKWWDGLIDLTTRFLNAVPQLPDHIRQLYRESAGYGGDPTLDYFAFIHERLLPTFIMLNLPALKVLPYHYVPDSPLDAMLEDIKLRCIETDSASLKENWFRLRDANYPGLAHSRYLDKFITAQFCHDRD
jgi:hypothetical protein